MEAKQVPTSELEKALRKIDDEIAKHPEKREWFVSKAMVLMELDRFEEAAQCYMDAADLDPAQAYNNVGICFHRAEKYEKAREFYAKALAMDPKNALYKTNLATVMEECGTYEEALQLFNEVIDANPDHVQARFNRCDLLMALGRLKEGWSEYAWRTKLKGKSDGYALYGFPRWDGSDIANKHILVWTEQGIGDEVLIASIFKDLSAVAREVTVLTSHRSHPFMKRCFNAPDFHVAEREVGLNSDTLKSYLPCIKSPVDFQFSLSDLGTVFRSDLSDFPVPEAYITSLKTRTNKLRNRYRKQFGYTKPLVGLAWGSNNGVIGNMKSVPIGYLYPLLARDDVTFVSLQHHFQPEVIDEFNGRCLDHAKEHGMPFSPIRYDKELGVSYANIEDLLSQIDAMDLVITSSNSVAHLAGAMGKEVLLILSSGRGRLWFWFRDNDHCYWYPNVRLFSQHKAGEWETEDAQAGVIHDVNKELNRWVDQRKLQKIAKQS